MRSHLGRVIALFHEAGKFFLNIPLFLDTVVWLYFQIILLLILLVMRSHLGLVVALFYEAGKFFLIPMFKDGFIFKLMVVFQIILLLILLVMRSRLGLVVALFHEAGKFFLNIPVLLIQPLWTFLILMAFLAVWVVVLAFISTAGNRDVVLSRGFVLAIRDIQWF